MKKQVKTNRSSWLENKCVSWNQDVLGDLDYEVVAFDEIIPKILDGTYTSGLIIHEGQLTYVEHDLDVLVDLGVWWNERTGGLPMPLGGNVVRKTLVKR